MTVFGTVPKIFGMANHSKKKKKKKSGTDGTRTHGRGSVPLMSKLDALPLRHKAETIFAAQIFIKNVSTGKTVVYTIVTVLFTLALLLSFSLSQHCCDIRYFTIHYFLH